MSNDGSIPGGFRAVSRRVALGRLGGSFGSLVLAALVAEESRGHPAPSRGVTTLAPRPGHFPARARAVIQLCQNGGPSQMDLFDHKPELSNAAASPIPAT